MFLAPACEGVLGDSSVDHLLCKPDNWSSDSQSPSKHPGNRASVCNYRASLFRYGRQRQGHYWELLAYLAWLVNSERDLVLSKVEDED